MINYFEVGYDWHLVDLPGYGYAKISKKKRKEWEVMIEGYLQHRTTLACVFLLIDSRIPPQNIDLEFMKWLVESEIPFVVVYTKTEKVKPKALSSNIEAFQTEISEFCEFFPRFFKSSSKSRVGRSEILGFIDDALTNLKTQF